MKNIADVFVGDKRRRQPCDGNHSKAGEVFSLTGLVYAAQSIAYWSSGIKEWIS